MRRRAKPAKAKVEAKLPIARKLPKSDGARVRDLERHLAEAQEQQAATAEILRVISRSQTDLQPVFDTIAQSAVRLCGGVQGNVVRFDGELVHRVAGFNLDPEGEEALRDYFPRAVGRELAITRTILDGSVVHLPDALQDADQSREITQATRARAILAVPMLRDGQPIGAISVVRREARPFSESQIALLQTFADQAVIAIENVRLFTELQAKNQALTQAHAQVTEALEQQTATAEILRLIAGSPTDLESVLGTVAETAMRVCGARDAIIYRRDGDVLRLACIRGPLPVSPSSLALPLNAKTATGRSVVERRTIHVHDLAAVAASEYPEALSRGVAAGSRTVLATPLLLDGEPLGAILMRRGEVQAFTDKQIALLETFADQAVIAIENVRLFTALEARNRDLTATAEILQVISRSPTDLQPVFDTIVRNAANVCGAFDATLALADGEDFVTPAHHGPIPRPSSKISMRGTVTGLAIREARTVHVADLLATEDFPIGKDLARKIGYRTVLVVPLLREGVANGAIGIRRTEVRPFTDAQIALLQTFADQAVIAIANVRLFTELEQKNRALTQAHAQVTESLEQQTATSEILRVISCSPTDIQPVFDAIVQSAVRLCEGLFGTVLRLDGDRLYLAAHHNLSHAGLQAYREHYPVVVNLRETVASGAILDRRVVQVIDSTDPAVPPRSVAMARATGFRGVVVVPMLRDGEPIGVINVARRERGPFTDRQVALLQTFADQAVIAIENVRLFNETKQALEQRTATSEILRVISSSPTDIQPVLDAVAQAATALCDAYDAWVGRLNGDLLRVAAHHGSIPVPVGDVVPAISGTVTGRSVIDRRTVHVADLQEAAAEYPEGSELAQRIGFRTALSVPLLREGMPIGVIHVRRYEVRPFTDKQIALLQTFADQAVIAIENVRLFNETKEALEQQTATSDILRTISSSPTDIQPVFEAIVENGMRLCEGDQCVLLGLRDGMITFLASHHKSPEAKAALLAILPLPVNRETTAGRAILDQCTVQIPDVLADPDYGLRHLTTVVGYRATIAVPMMREGHAIGAMTVSREAPGEFSARQIEILKTFADQAIIAIENVRLFTELQEKNQALTQAHAQVTEALEQQTATAEILRVISSSPTDVQPVFDAIVETGARLCEADFGLLARYDGTSMAIVAQSGATNEEIKTALRAFPRGPTPDSLGGRAILERAVIHIPDVRSDPRYGLRVVQDAGWRTGLGVPLLREGVAIGAVGMWRRDVRPFSDRQIELLKVFADQAVIAIENVRLFTELQTSNRDLTTALDTQTATSDILRVISRSQTDVQPVFDAIVSSAVRLLRGYSGALIRVAGDRLELAALTSTVDVGVAAQQARFPQPLQSPGPHAETIRARAPINVVDAQTDSGWESEHAYARARGYRSLVAVPLLRHRQAIGAIVVTRRELGGFTDDEIALLQTFADQAVIAIENARLLTELQTRTAELTRSVGELTALGEVGRALSSTLDLETVLQTIVLRANKLARTAGCAIWEYDEAREEFRLRASDYVDEEDAAALQVAAPVTTIRRGLGVTSQVMELRQPVQIHDIAVGGAEENPIRQRLIAAGHHALLAVPLLREDEVLGVLVVTRKTPGEFQPEVVQLLSTFATQSALAIQNARLFREIEIKSRQLEVASQHKSEFLANMSHELRTPLNAIIGFSEVLSERMFGELNEKQEEYLKDIHASGQHLLSLINDILDLSKIEAGRMELELTEFDLPTAIDNALTLVRERAGRRGIALHQATDEDLGQIRGDERKIKQVLLNLLSNAIKFTPDGGRIEVRTIPVDGSVEVSVTDTGVGIAPDDQEAIFEEFRQVGTAAKKVEGTGLGLALARKFVELHGGRIWVQSQLGVGSTFTFTIPVRRGE